MGFGTALGGFAQGFEKGYKLITDEDMERRAKEKSMSQAEEDASARANAPAPTRDYTQPSKDNFDPRSVPSFAAVAPRLKADLQKDFGLDQEKASGVVGSLAHESGGFGTLQETNPVVSGSRGGFGYAQWTGPRRVAFEEYARKNNLAPTSYEANYGFLRDELTNTPEGAVLGRLKNAPDRASAAKVFTEGFLRPGVPAMDSRLKWTERARQAALNVDDEDAVDAQGNRVRPGVYAASGGAIEEPEPVSALPLTGPAPSGMMSEESTSREGGPSPARNLHQKELLDLRMAGEAADSGMKYIQSVFGFDKPTGVMGASPQHQDGLQAFARNVGAATQEELAGVDNAVDPKRVLTGDERALARLNGAYRYYVEKGEPQKAQQAAASMLMHIKSSVQMAGNMVQTAKENNDIQGMADAIAQGKDEIPDGQTVKVKKVTPQGAEFQVFDADGRITSEGKATVDEMMRIGAGMQNGSQWFEQIGAIKGKSAAERKTESERAAIDEFEGSRVPGEKEFIATLDDKQKEAFLKMPRSAQNMYRREHERTLEAERKQGNIEDRVDRELENRDYKRDLDMFKMAVGQGRWEDQRDRSMTQFERQLAQRERDLDDRNTRQELSQEARDKRNAQIDQRILETRTQRQAAAQAKAAGGGAKTAGERADKDITDRETGALEDIANAPEAAGAPRSALPVGRTTTPDPASGEAPVPLPLPGDVQGTENYGPTGEQYDRMSAVQAGSAYARSANDRKVNARDIETFRADKEAIGTGIAKAWEGASKPLSEGQQRLLTGIASNIVEGNGTQYTPQDAVDLVRKAVDPKVTPRVLGDGRVQFDPTMSPVKISEEAMMQLAMLRRQAHKAETGTSPTSAIPTNPTAPAQGVSHTATPSATAPTTPLRGANTTTRYAKDPSDRNRDDERNSPTNRALLEESKDLYAQRHANRPMTPQEWAEIQERNRRKLRGLPVSPVIR